VVATRRSRLLSIKTVRRLFPQVMVALQITLIGLHDVTSVYANPNGGTVVAGAATMQQTGNTLQINQTTSRAIINWNGFSIQPGETTRFALPDASSAVLNRVTGGNPSAILGTLESNGRVLLINPSGIVVGNGAYINVGSLIASSLDLPDSQFMQGGDLNF